VHADRCAYPSLALKATELNTSTSCLQTRYSAIL
jgi:hypothetical protein